MTGNRQGRVEHLTELDGIYLNLHEYGFWCAPNQAVPNWAARRPFLELARNALIPWLTELTLFGFGNFLGAPEKC
jgi:hypothetical protein